VGKRLSTRAFARLHEEFIARMYRGRVSPSSGASVVDQGDVNSETHNLLIECKARGHNNPVKSVSVNFDILAKIADEAYEQGMEPMLALRGYCPDNPLADPDGYIDVAVRLVRDDVYHVENSLG
jgi:hypothetical protein